MPWNVGLCPTCPASKPWAVTKAADGSVAGCHPSQEEAEAHRSALYESEETGEGASGAFDNPDGTPDGTPENPATYTVPAGQVAIGQQVPWQSGPSSTPTPFTTPTTQIW